MTAPRVPSLPDGPVTPGLVSVVLPTWNRAYVVSRAIESVLAQSYAPVELIVVDDGSTDNTAQVLARYGSRLRCITQPNGGVVAARNSGLAVVRGEFVALLDSDDEWLPWKLEVQVAILRCHAEAGMVCTDMSAVDQRGVLKQERYLRTFYAAYQRVDADRLLAHSGTAAAYAPGLPAHVQGAAVRVGRLFPEILEGNLVHTSTVLLRRARLAEIGGFDATLHGSGEDYDFHLRTCAAGPVALLDVPTIRYRVGAEDQLTAPAMQLTIAQNDLATIERWLGHWGEQGPLPPKASRRRLSRTHAWIGERQLLAGDRLDARNHLIMSWRLHPGADRRAMLLGASLLPDSIGHLARKAWWLLRHGRYPPA